MKATLLYLLLFICPFWSLAQSNEQAPKAEQAGIPLIKSFIKDLSDDDIALDVILSEYVTVNEPTDELYDYLEASLQEIRINLLSKNINNIQYKRYKELPRKEIKDIDPEDLNTEAMYFLYHKDRLLTSIYVSSGKIASFTLVSKGNELAHFVTY